MEKLREIIKNKKIVSAIILILILVGGGIYYLYVNSSNGYDSIENISKLEKIEENKQEENNNKEESKNMIESTNANEEMQSKPEEKIAIHITGEVKKTGIIYLKQGARIADAIEAAGGATKNASLEQVNLAYVLEDGQKIYIPNKKEKIEGNMYIIANSGNNVMIENSKTSKDKKTGLNTNQNTKGEKAKVNINSANQTELETLPGVGEALAQRIIEYRESNGKFQKIEDIQNVKGIGNSKYSNIKEKICI